MIPAKKTSSGYALIVVLFGLTILTLIFGIATDRSIAFLSDARSEMLLIERAEQRVALLEIAARWKAIPENADVHEVGVTIGEEVHQLRFQDVGGLIDLNTATSELLEVLFRGVLDNPNEVEGALAALRDWRRDDRRLQRASDLRRIARLSETEVARVKKAATVWSGRRGVSEVVAPAEVLALFDGSGAIPDELQSAPSTVNFRVVSEGGILGAIHVPQLGILQ